MLKTCLFLMLSLSLPALAERPEIEKLTSTQTFETRLGSTLTPLTEKGFSPRLTSIRRYLAQELGWVLPGTTFTENASLAPNEYQIYFQGQLVGSAKVEAGKVLAVGPESKLTQLDGPHAKDPTYGMPGVWVPAADKEKAEKLGFMVFDPVSVWATQLTELARVHAAEQYTADHLKAALAIWQSGQPALVNRFSSDPVAFERLLKVMRNLLVERVCVRDLGSIAEVVLRSPQLDVDSLSEAARAELAGSILGELATDQTLQAAQVGPKLDASIRKLGSHTAQGLIIAESPDIQQQILPAVKSAVESMADKGLMPVLVTTPEARLTLRRLTLKDYPNLVVLANTELTPYYTFESAGVVELK